MEVRLFILVCLMFLACGEYNFVVNIDLNARVNAFCDTTNANNMCEEYLMNNNRRVGDV